MQSKRYLTLLARLTAGGALVGAGSYAAYAGWTWFRYGRRKSSSCEDVHLLLDSFMPDYDVSERHQIRICAPADLVFSAAREMEMAQSVLTRSIISTRERALDCVGYVANQLSLERSAKAWKHAGRPASQGLIEELIGLGWVVLKEIASREIVLGTVTQPWVAQTVFRPVPSDRFVGFHEPNYVKILFSLRVESVSGSQSVALTETRVVTTDAAARSKFRVYWSLFSPGIFLIRRALLRSLKCNAERYSRVLNRKPASPIPSIPGPIREVGNGQQHSEMSARWK